jgi:hypothetical protein
MREGGDTDTTGRTLGSESLTGVGTRLGFSMRLSEGNSGGLDGSFHVSSVTFVASEFPTECVASIGSANFTTDDGLALDIGGKVGKLRLGSVPMDFGIERSFQFHDAGGIAFGRGTILKVTRMVFVSGKKARRKRGLDSCAMKIPASDRVCGKLSLLE